MQPTGEFVLLDKARVAPGMVFVAAKQHNLFA